MTSVTMMLVTSVLAGPVLDFVEGAEVGTSDQFVALESRGKYHAEKVDKKNGNTVLKGTWAIAEPAAGVKENGLEQRIGTVSVKVATCTGPQCKALKKDYSLDIELQAERAMVVKANPIDNPMFPTGSYYCRFQGCEKRTGVEMLAKDAKPRAMNYLLDYLIDQNRKRDVTVVWWGKKLTVDAGKTRVEYCTRDAERGKKGAEQVAADLAGLPWVGPLEVTESKETNCLWDVRVYVADNVLPPAKQR